MGKVSFYLHLLCLLLENEIVAIFGSAEKITQNSCISHLIKIITFSDICREIISLVNVPWGTTNDSI